MIQKIGKLFGALILLNSVFGCVSPSAPYHDAAFYDHNPPSANLKIPTDYQSIPSDEIKKKSEVDYYFLNTDLNADGKKDQLKDLLWLSEKEPNSVVLLQKISLDYYQRGDFQKSQEFIEKALAIEPKHRENLLLYGSILMTTKSYDKAEVVYTKLSKLYPEDAEPYLYLGAVNAEKNNSAKAIQNFSQVIALDNYDQKHLPYYYRARTYIESKNPASVSLAMKDLEKCFELKSDFLEAIQAYANIIEKTQGKAKVFAFYENYQKKYGPVVRIAEVLAQYYIEKNDYNKAYEQLSIVEANSDDPMNAKLKIALILIDRKDFANAKAKLEELLTIVPESDKVRYYLSAVYETLENPKKAIDLYLSITSDSQYFEDSRMRAALLLKSSKQFAQAHKVLQEATQKKDNVQFYLASAQIYEEQDQFSEAISVLENSLKVDPKNSMVYYYIGAIQDKLNKKDLVVLNMKKSLILDEKNVQAMNYLAYTYSELNQNLDEAEALALKASGLQKNDPYILDTLGWIYFQKTDYAKAEKFLEQAHQLMPSASIIAEHLGDVYAKMNKEDKAKGAYLKAKKEETDLLKIKNLDNKISLVEKVLNQRLPASASNADK